MDKYKILDSERSSIWEIPYESLIKMPKFYKWLRSYPANKIWDYIDEEKPQLSSCVNHEILLYNDGLDYDTYKLPPRKGDIPCEYLLWHMLNQDLGSVHIYWTDIKQPYFLYTLAFAPGDNILSIVEDKYYCHTIDPTQKLKFLDMPNMPANGIQDELSRLIIMEAHNDK